MYYGYGADHFDRNAHFTADRNIHRHRPNPVWYYDRFKLWYRFINAASGGSAFYRFCSGQSEDGKSGKSYFAILPLYGDRIAFIDIYPGNYYAAPEFVL